MLLCKSSSARFTNTFSACSGKHWHSQGRLWISVYDQAHNRTGAPDLAGAKLLFDAEVLFKLLSLLFSVQRQERFSKFLALVEKGKVKVNAGALDTGPEERAN